MSEAFPGVEIHAHLLSGLLDGRLPVRPDVAVGYEAALALLTGGGLALALPAPDAAAAATPRAGRCARRLRNRLWPITAALLLLVLLNLALYRWAGLAMPLAASVIAVMGVAVLGLILPANANNQRLPGT